MTMSKHLAQAHRQAPWRLQTQRGVLILIVTILVASVLWVMVSVTVRAASAGLEIQSLEQKQDNYKRQIAALRTQYAILTSANLMEERAASMGFQPVDPANITFVVIPGYRGRSPNLQTSPPGAAVDPPLVKPAYTQSLWEWLVHGYSQMSEQPGVLSP